MWYDQNRAAVLPREWSMESVCAMDDQADCWKRKNMLNFITFFNRSHSQPTIHCCSYVAVMYIYSSRCCHLTASQRASMAQSEGPYVMMHALFSTTELLLSRTCRGDDAQRGINCEAFSISDSARCFCGDRDQWRNTKSTQILPLPIHVLELRMLQWEEDRVAGSQLSL